METSLRETILVSKYQVTISKPTFCKYCRSHIHPVTESISELSQEKTFAVLYSCPSCKKYFFKAYRKYDSGEYGYAGKELDYGEPETFYYIPEEIKQISPDFIKIYNQALLSEIYQLNDIVGISLRKSIEFLIKDYLITRKDISKDFVKTATLMQCIRQIDNPKLIALSKSCAWIGNDETHYVRIHKDKDVSDMKKFINALIYFISLELVSKDAIEFTSSKISE